MMRAGEVSAALTAQVDSVASYLLPNGVRDGREWCAGSVHGEAGKSLKLCIIGPKAGRWKDFESGEKGGDLIDLWCAVRGVSLAEAITQAKDYLGIRENRVENRQRSYAKPTRDGMTLMPPQMAQWLREVRKISDETIAAFKLVACGSELVFPYLRDGELLAVKYRKVPGKVFRQAAGCEPCLFGWQAFPPRARTAVICEGEMDALAFREYGIPALSVPMGAGAGGNQAGWIESEFDRLAVFDCIFLALDDDAAGHAGTADIVKRLGRERCRIVTLPRKDANECLMEGVPREAIAEALANARTLDPEELHSAADYVDDLEREFSRATEPEPGIRLPWEKVNDQLVLRMGEVSLWAGYSGHGKSEVAGHITAAALRDGWRACVGSMEFRPPKWLKRLVRQITAQGAPSLPYVRHVGNWFRDKLWVFDVTGTAKSATVLEVFAYAARRYGVKLFIIDNLSKCGIADDDYNGQKGFADALTDFAKQYDVHVVLVHHLRKTESEDKPGGKMDVKGGGGITDMVDTVVNVWRNKPKEKALRKLKLREGKAATEAEQEAVDTEAQELRERCDCLLQCHKQRNGEHEPSVLLWFDRTSHQFLQNDTAKPRPIITFAVGAPLLNVESVPEEELL